MKILLCAAAMAMGTAAIAQTQDPTEPAPETAPAPAAEQRPERDARGIPVVSETATAPSGTNQPFSVPQGAEVVLSPDQQQAFAPQPAQGEMPPCSRTVTDRCTQTYERGVRAPR